MSIVRGTKVGAKISVKRDVLGNELKAGDKVALSRSGRIMKIGVIIRESPKMLMVQRETTRV